MSVLPEQVCGVCVTQAVEAETLEADAARERAESRGEAVRRPQISILPREDKAVIVVRGPEDQTRSRLLRSMPPKLLDNGGADGHCSATLARLRLLRPNALIRLL